uniref:Uncharacterized protein n=1 Tax=Urocitellus parryii TaxID=9999 RepID=A0A8D2HZU0_UROPR
FDSVFSGNNLNTQCFSTSTCFIMTTCLVLGWFGCNNPVILRNSEETQFSTVVLTNQIRQVKNPFGLEITNQYSSLVHGLSGVSV